MNSVQIWCKYKHSHNIYFYLQSSKLKNRLNIDRNESDVLKYSHEVEYLVTSCMMSKSNEIRLESYSTILRLVTVNFYIKSQTF